jgi:predicted dehydrogenase
VKRLGLVGVGAWGRRYIDSIACRNDCRIAAVARASVRVDAGVPGATAFESWQALLRFGQQGHLDGLIVATTPENQAEVARAALMVGMPVLVEKPLGLSQAMSAGLLRSLRETARASPFLVNFVHLWAPAYRALKSRVQASSAGGGRLASIESAGCNNGPFRAWPSVYDYGSHDVALCLDLAGPRAAFRLDDAVRLPSETGGAGELVEARLWLDDVTVTMRLGNGSAIKRRRLSATLDGGRTLTYDDVRPHPDKLIDGESAVAVALTRPLDAVLDDFVGQLDLWRRGALPPEVPTCSLEFAARVARILDAVAAAARP